MKTEQIFQEFEQRLEKEYYAQLASKEILTVPLLIEIFLTMITQMLTGRNRFLSIFAK